MQEVWLKGIWMKVHVVKTVRIKDDWNTAEWMNIHCLNEKCSTESWLI